MEKQTCRDHQHLKTQRCKWYSMIYQKYVLNCTNLYYNLIHQPSQFMVDIKVAISSHKPLRRSRWGPFEAPDNSWGTTRNAGKWCNLIDFGWVWWTHYGQKGPNKSLLTAKWGFWSRYIYIFWRGRRIQTPSQSSSIQVLFKGNASMTTCVSKTLFWVVQTGKHVDRGI